ncbi:MAG: hypothetical protein P8101_00510 [Candidatus Thiodiazotropha sp.]
MGDHIHAELGRQQNISADSNEDSPYSRYAPVFLRLIGSTLVLTALSLFLFQHWDSGDDLFRYWLLLGFNVMLTIFGIFTSRLLRETKGARTFLMLALASIPINFTILGAFLYTLHPLDMLMVSYPDYATWQIGDKANITLAGIAGIISALVISALGFRVLAGNLALKLSLLFIAANSTLLIPLRHADHVVWMLLGFTGLAFFAVQRITRNAVALNTFEGSIAKIVVMIPMLLMLARSVWLYPITQLFQVGMVLLTWWVLRALSNTLGQQHVLHPSIEIFSFLTGSWTAFLVAGLAQDYWGIDHATSVNLIAYVIAAFSFEMSLRGTNFAHFFRYVAGLSLVAGALSALSISGDGLTVLICILNGLLVMTLGFLMRSLLALVMGSAAFLSGLGYQIWRAMTYLDVGGLGSLVIVGALIILSASLIERHGYALRRLIRTWRQDAQES